jgi:hypothetical protein
MMVLSLIIFNQGMGTPASAIPSGFVLNQAQKCLPFAIDQLSSVTIANFESRSSVQPERLDRQSLPGNPSYYLDRFSTPDSSKSILLGISASLGLENGGFISGPAQGPVVHRKYLVGFAKPTPGQVFLPLSIGGRVISIRIRGESLWRPALICLQISRENLVTKAISQKAGAVPTTFAAFGDMLIAAGSVEETRSVCQLILRWQVSQWDSVKVPGGSPSAWLIDQWERPVLRETQKRPDDLRAQILGVCSLLPGSNSGKERFRLLVKMAEQGHWPPFAEEGRVTATADELIGAAIRFPSHRQFFFDRTKGAPSDSKVKAIVGWLITAKPSLALAIFNRLAYWAQRSDLAPKIADKYVDGQPVILNRDELTKLWRDNPPQIKVHR